MTDQLSATTTCALCGVPCEGKPHAKDSKGRAICRPCMDLKRAEKASRHHSPQAEDTMAALLAKSKMASATPCPGCKSYLAQGHVICGHCGYNVQTGKAMTTRVYTAPKEKKQTAARTGPSFSFDPMMGVWAAALVFSALAIGTFAVPPLLLVMYGLLALHGTVVSVWFVVAAFLDGDAMWGIIMLIPGVNTVGLYYILVKSPRSVLRIHWVMVLGFAILMVLLATSVLPEEALQGA